MLVTMNVCLFISVIDDIVMSNDEDVTSQTAIKAPKSIYR